MSSFWIYLFLMAGVTYLVRALPFGFMRSQIENRFVRSFLHYIPYTVLTVMTLPGALYATGNVLSAAVGLSVAVAVALKWENLSLVALAACAATLVSALVFS